MVDEYATVEGTSEGLYKEKGSKFLAKLYPIRDENELKEFLNDAKKEHPNAVHFCYAFRLGPSGENYRANDDGEPAGSAGKPILNQLLSANLQYVLLLVVRYYGGTKLGVSGLINAYKLATAEAVLNAEIVNKRLVDYFELQFSYENEGEANRFIRDQKADIVQKEFGSSCKLIIALSTIAKRQLDDKLPNYKQLSLKWLYKG